MEILNAKITSADIVINEYNILTINLTLEGDGWGIGYDSYSLGRYWACSKTYEGDSRAGRVLMELMSTIGVNNFQDLVGQYVRVELESTFGPVHSIGNIITDKWFSFAEILKDTSNSDTSKHKEEY